MNHKSLVKIESSIVSIEKQISIANKILYLNQEENLKLRVFNLINNINIDYKGEFKFTIYFLSRFYTINSLKLSKHSNRFDWALLSRNKKVNKTEGFYNNISIDTITTALNNKIENFEFSDEIISKYLKYFAKINVFYSEHIFFGKLGTPWNFDRLEKYEDKIDLNQILKNNEYIEWSDELITKYKTNINWFHILENYSNPYEKCLFPWNEEIFTWVANKNWINCDGVLLWAAGLPWSFEFLKKYEKCFFLGIIGQSELLPWNIEIINYYIDEINWSDLSRNTSINWTTEIIDEFHDKWDWLLLSKNPSLQWSINFISNYSDMWNWDELSKNTGLPWSNKLIKHFKDKWQWGICLFVLKKDKYSLIEKYLIEINWEYFSQNAHIIDFDILKKYQKKINFPNLAENENFKWSLEIIEEFNNKYFWRKTNYRFINNLNNIIEEIIDENLINKLLENVLDKN